MVSETLTEAAVAGKVRLIGATSSAAYEQYIAGNVTLDALFKQVNLGDITSAENNDKEDASADTVANSNGFQGEKISADLQHLVQAGRKDRVNVILQVDDVKSGQLNDLFKQYGIKITAQMSRLGAIEAEVPVEGPGRIGRTQFCSSCFAE